MNNNLTEVAFVLDASGSMQRLTADTIGGFNSVIESQKNQPGETRVTTVIFNNQVYMLHECEDIKNIKPLTTAEYQPGGTTALYDAIGYTVDMIGERLADTAEEERPAQVMIVIITDGVENASHEYKFKDIQERIETQQNTYSWKFMFLGANLEAMSEAAKLGIAKETSKGYTCSARGTDSVYRAVDTVLTHSKTALASGNSYDISDIGVTLDAVVK